MLEFVTRTRGEGIVSNSDIYVDDSSLREDTLQRFPLTSYCPGGTRRERRISLSGHMTKNSWTLVLTFPYSKINKKSFNFTYTLTDMSIDCN